MTRMGIASIACAAALAVACNGNGRTDQNANDSAAVGTAGNASERALLDGDRDFINRQLSNGMAEVELAKMAGSHAASGEVKRFATMMIQDHTKAGNDLQQVASEFNVQPAPVVDDAHQSVANRLATLEGAEFDREYMKVMVDGHQDAIDKLESRVDSTASLKDRITNNDSAPPVAEKSDNAVKASVNAWAATALPVVRHHLDEARRINDQLDSARSNSTARK